jgi:hypothetical protein
MKIARKLTRYFLNHPAIFILAAFVFAGSVYSATTIGSNITTAGNLEVTGNATTTEVQYIGSRVNIAGQPSDDLVGSYSPSLFSFSYETSLVGQNYSGAYFSNLIDSVQFGSATALTASTTAVSVNSANPIGLKGLAFGGGAIGVSGEGSHSTGVVKGVAGNAIGGSSNYAVFGSAYSSTEGATNVGIYGAAGNGDINYAGYFDGDVQVTGALTPAAGESAPATPVEGSFAVDTAEQDCFDGGDGTDGGSLCVYTGDAWVVVKTW